MNKLLQDYKNDFGFMTVDDYFLRHIWWPHFGFGSFLVNLFFTGWDRRGPKTFKSNEVVWDAKMVAMKPEKMF